MTKEPRTIPEFRRWLTEAFDTINLLCKYGEPDFFDTLDVADTVDQAARLACRFGAGHLAGPEQAMLSPREALAIIGRILVWAESQSQFFDAVQASNYLGITRQSLYDLVERKKLTPLRGPRRTYRFTKKQLDDYHAENTKLCV
jgi:excisionase family DNA binding protein